MSFVQPYRASARIIASLLFLAALVVCASTATAQTITFIGDRGGNCISLPGGAAPHSFTVTISNVAAGRTIVITAATSGNATLGSITDSKGNSYPGDISQITTGVNFSRVFVHSRAITNALIAGVDTITLNYTGSAVNETSCATAHEFSNVLASGTRTEIATGSNGTGMAHATPMATTTLQKNQLLVANFVTTTATGGFTIGAPFGPMQGACLGSFCMFPEFRIVNAFGTYQGTASSVNSVVWASAFVCYLDTTAPVELQKLTIE